MGNRFVSFVLAYTRSGCRVELDVKFRGPGFSLFPFAPGWSWGFSFVGLGGPGELSLFPCGRGSFPFSLSTLPELVIQLHTLFSCWAYRYAWTSMGIDAQVSKFLALKLKTKIKGLGAVNSKYKIGIS